jgi:hypothetical protein
VQHADPLARLVGRELPRRRARRARRPRTVCRSLRAEDAVGKVAVRTSMLESRGRGGGSGENVGSSGASLTLEI